MRHIKDIRILQNRHLKNLVIVDNSIVAFGSHLENGIHIPTYYGQANDCHLLRVKELLKLIANSSDIRDDLNKLVGLKKLYEEYADK